jgi:hypothetical protein
VRTSLAVLAICGWLVGCKAEPSGQTSQSRTRNASEAPDDVKQTATLSIRKYVLQSRPQGEIDQWTIVASAMRPLTGADRANRITEKWCVGMSYVVRESATRPWEDGRRVVLVVRDGNGLTPSKTNYNDYVMRDEPIAMGFSRCLEDRPFY